MEIKESTYWQKAKQWDLYHKELAEYQQRHKQPLAKLEAQLTAKYAPYTKTVLAAYYDQAQQLVAARETEIISTREDVELVAQYQGKSSEDPESIAAAKAAMEARIAAAEKNLATAREELMQASGLEK